MHYLLLIYQDEAARSQWSEEELAAEYQEYFTFSVESEKKGVSAGAALMPTNTATTVRVRNGKILTTDGPFAETKEQLGGYFILHCNDLDKAIEIAAQIPGVKHGSIEIRPVMEVEGMQ
jgi:hypothetical protein